MMKPSLALGSTILPASNISYPSSQHHFFPKWLPSNITMYSIFLMSCVHILSPPLECNYCDGRDCGQIYSLLYSYHLLKQCPAQVGEWNK